MQCYFIWQIEKSTLSLQPKSDVDDEVKAFSPVARGTASELASLEYGPKPIIGELSQVSEDDFGIRGLFIRLL